MSKEPNAVGNLDGKVLLADRYRVHPDKPIPALDSPMAVAFEASDLSAPARHMFALVCRPDLTARIDIIPHLARMLRLGMVAPVGGGVVSWPETGGRRFAIVFERNFGERVLASPEATITPVSEDHLIRIVIQPLMTTIKELENRFITHRAIRADNLFYKDVTQNEVVLGECVSAPPAISQPAIYEPIESAIAMPSCRGSGKSTEDLYAFGVMLAVLLNGGNPVKHMSDEEIIADKISRGSYSALIGQSRVSLKLMEPLRGLLCDDPKERWTAANLESWLGGQQLSPKQPMLPARATRAMIFAGKEYWTRPALSYAMGRNWQEAGKLITSGELEGWIRRALSDDKGADAIRDAVMDSSGRADREDTLIARILMVFEPTHPIRYKDYAANLEGIPTGFAADFHNQEIRETFVEFMKAKLPQTYLQSQSSGRPDAGALMKTFEMMSYFTENSHLGGGLARALYESNPAWPCQSPLVADYYVTEVDDLLPALDKVAQHGTPDTGPVDAHVVGFCATQIKSVSDRILKMLNSTDPATHQLGMLHVLAEVQRKHGKKRTFPALGAWVARLVRPTVETYHNQVYKQRLARELDRASNNGDLMEILFLVDSMDARTQDTDGFEKARKDYSECVQGITWLENGGLTSTAYVLAKCQHASTIVSAIVSGVAIIGLTLIYVM